jgi:hypothetical protein
MEITKHARRSSRHRSVPAASVKGTAIALGLMLLVAERPAHAYIDPGSGSLIYQTALGLLLGFGFMFRRVAAGVARFFKSRDGGTAEGTADAVKDSTGDR